MTAINGRRLRGIALIGLAMLVPMQMGGCLFDIPFLIDCTDNYTDISVADAFAMVQARSGDADFIILDVRTADEFATGHIEGAVNLCILCAASFRADLASFDPALTYLVYCKSGSRSANASCIMAEEGFTDVNNMLGGIDAWVDAGHPVVIPD